MPRLRLRKLMLLIPILALATAVVSCGGGKPSSSAGDGKEDPEPKAERKELDSKGWGTVKGRATLDGEKPNLQAENQKVMDLMTAHKDKDTCLKGTEAEKGQQKWMISDSGGVANVVVWLRPPDDTFFKIKKEETDPSTATLWKKEVVFDQPHCAFGPRAMVLFPSYPDPAAPKKQKPTMQVFKVKNSAPITHNTKYEGRRNPGENFTIPAGEERIIKIQPDPGPIGISCTMHTWMNANAWAFEHPYAAVTDKDGNFEIKGAPAGVDLQIVAWHEGNFIGSNKGEKLNVKPDGETTKDFKVKAK